MITIYGAPPTRALRVTWMLEEMGLPYEIKSVDFAKRHEDAEFIKANPAGAFPAMRDGEVLMMESCAIMEYLGARHGPTPLVPQPRDPSWPAYMSFLHFGESSLCAPMNVTIASRFFAPDEHKQNWGSDFAVDNFARKAKVLTERLKDRPYLAGETFTAADISCAYTVGLARNFAGEDKVDPELRDWHDKLQKRPAYQKAMSAAQPPGL